MNNSRRPVGRHSAPTPASVDSHRSRPSRRALSAVVGGALIINLGVLVGLHAAGISVLRTSSEAAASPAAGAPLPVVNTDGVTPARKAVVAILNDGPGNAWTASGSIAWAAGTAFDFACPATGLVAPVVSGSRLFTRGGQSITVSARAYSAGQGAVAFSGLFSAWRNCDQEGTGVGVVSASAPGVDAMTGWVSSSTAGGPSSSLVWRRGDVLLSVSHTGTAPSGLASRAYQVDAVADSTIAVVCADVSSTLADAARSPWATKVGYTGLQVAVPITIPGPAVPTPPAGVTAVPDDVTVSAPPVLTLPAIPLGSVSPSALPSPIAAPLVPLRPTPAPSTTSVLDSQRDTVGPGCGWAFTGQAIPQFDAASAADALSAAQDEARASLLAQQAAWQQQTIAFWQQYATYNTELTAFTNYVDQVNVIAAAWSTIETNRTTYAAAVLAYNQAVAARTTFLAQQGQAEATYNAQLSACAGSSATATPTPTALPTATAPVDSPTPTDSPTPSPTDSPTPTATPTLLPGCPPARPAILDQPIPTVPPQPSPVP